MSNHIHLNLIKEEEIVSSSPVRTQVVAPIIVSILTACILSWWVLLLFEYSSEKKLNRLHNQNHEQLQAGYRQALALKAEAKEISALIAQLQAYARSKISYAETFKDIPEHVLPNIQFTKLEVLEPPTPLFAKDKLATGPTNRTEAAKFVITGRTSGLNAFNSVDHLLSNLKKAPFTNMIQSAHIPKGSLRQDKGRTRDAQEFLRFEIECACTPRRFE